MTQREHEEPIAFPVQGDESKPASGELAPAVEETDEPDPFQSWPQPESAAVIEDMPVEGASVEHVSGEIDIPDEGQW